MLPIPGTVARELENIDKQLANAVLYTVHKLAEAVEASLQIDRATAEIARLIDVRLYLAQPLAW
jgi:hypothetical protein